jgi:hypothetical protein
MNYKLWLRSLCIYGVYDIYGLYDIDVYTVDMYGINGMYGVYTYTVFENHVRTSRP